MKRAYVYIVLDRNGIPRYVGKGKGNRWKYHNAGRSHNKILAGMIRDAGAEFPVVIIRENLSDDEAFEIEIALIKAIGRIEFGGTLVNLTDGGEGQTNMSAEGRASISKYQREHGSPKRSPETRARISAGHTGLKHSDEHRAAISKGWETREPATAETRAKMSVSAKKRDRSAGLSQSHKEAMRASHLAYWERRRQAGLPMRHPRRQKRKG